MSVAPIEKLLERLRLASAKWREAAAKEDVPKANGHVVVAWRAIETLVRRKLQEMRLRKSRTILFQI